MTIKNDQVTISADELSGLSDLALKALQAKADQTNITIQDFISGALTDRLDQIKSDLVAQSFDANKDIVASLVTASPGLLESIRKQLNA